MALPALKAGLMSYLLFVQRKPDCTESFCRADHMCRGKTWRESGATCTEELQPVHFLKTH